MPGAVVGGSEVRRLGRGGGGVQVPAKEGGSITPRVRTHLESP